MMCHKLLHLECTILLYCFVCLPSTGFKHVLICIFFKAEVCSRHGSEGGKCVPDKDGLLDLGPFAVRGMQCKSSIDLTSVVSILKGQMNKILTLCTVFADWNACFQLIKEAWL